MRIELGLLGWGDYGGGCVCFDLYLFWGMGVINPLYLNLNPRNRGGCCWKRNGLVYEDYIGSYRRSEAKEIAAL